MAKSTGARRQTWPPPPGTTLNDVIPDYLPDLDGVLTKMNVELSARPLRAASMFVKYFVRDIKGDTKEEYFTRPWFAVIYAVTHGWYVAKYGEGFDRSDPGFPAVIQIHDWPYLVHVPFTHPEPGDEPDTVWMSFDVRLGRDEAPRKWIQHAPNLVALSKREAMRLDRDLARLTDQVRTIHVYFMTSQDAATPRFDELRNVALLALRNAAGHIQKNTPHSLALALWEINYALENALKALIDQAGAKFSYVHDLRVLLEEAARAGRRPFPKSALAFMPSAKRVMKHRYGKSVPGGRAEVVRAYGLALDRLVRIGARLDRDLQLEHASFLLKRPPWMSMLPEFQHEAKEAVA